MLSDFRVQSDDSRVNDLSLHTNSCPHPVIQLLREYQLTLQTERMRETSLVPSLNQEKS